MIYDSIEIIPAKIFFKILDTGDYTLLSNEKVDKDELIVIWEALEEQHNQIMPNKESDNVLNLSKKIEMLSAKMEAVSLSVYHLRTKEDAELIELLKSYGYKFTGDLHKDLDKIEKESEAIKIKIDKISNRLPKQKKDTAKNETSFDESVMSYSAFTGSGFIDTNKITLTQYYALVNITNQKIKALESGKKG